MSGIFSWCKKLSSLPDISKWDTSNVGNMSQMFLLCESLAYIPDISNWNTNNCYIMIHMFARCISLVYLPKIEKLITPFTRTYSMLEGCFNLNNIPDEKLTYDVRLRGFY